MIHRNNLTFNDAFSAIKSDIKHALEPRHWDTANRYISELATGVETDWLTLEQAIKRARFYSCADLEPCKAHNIRGCSRPNCN